MISKELITQALRMYPQYDEHDECTGNIQYRSGTNIVHFEVNSNSMSLANTYELAHKCKEWAYNLEYVLTSQFQYDYKSVTQTPKAIVFIDNPLFKGIEVITASTEPEAIFKACEYILKLDNKEPK